MRSCLAVFLDRLRLYASLGFWLVVCGASSLFLLRFFKSWELLTHASSGWQTILGAIVRLLIVLPFVIAALLALHPVRLPRLINQKIWHGWRRLRSQPLPPSAPHDERVLSRRRFITEAALLGAGVSYATLVEPLWLETKRVAMPIHNLPPRFVGMKIVQISDLHVNAYITADDMARVVAHVNQLMPDVVVITGDFVDRDAMYADDATVPLMQLQARDGIFSVLGNHDYYTGKITRVKWAIKRAGLGLLVNQHTTLRRGADRLTLVGLDDPKHDYQSSFSRESINPKAALAGTNPSDPQIMLIHNPILAPLLAQHYAPDWILSGHTHGGQIRVPILTAEAVKSRDLFVRGHYWLDSTQLYVNRGIGFTGPPLRFRVRPEITLFELKPTEW